VSGNWVNAIGECLSTGFLEHRDWACYWWCLFHPFFKNYESKRSQVQFNHYVFLRVCPLCTVFFLSSLLFCWLLVFWGHGICFNIPAFPSVVSPMHIFPPVWKKIPSYCLTGWSYLILGVNLRFRWRTFTSKYDSFLRQKYLSRKYQI